MQAPVAKPRDAALGIDASIALRDEHRSHGSQDVVAEASTVGVDWGRDGTDDAGSGFTELGQDHPGMACVFLVDLRSPEFAAVGEPGALVHAPLAQGRAWVCAPEPPVPRFS